MVDYFQLNLSKSFPILLIVYSRQAKIEKREELKMFENKYKECKKKTSAFIMNHLNNRRKQ
ncbi:hypothetical protein HYW75_02245 [Candidatus Pacearchaeota archaeon]|nr:hypothetical protein [Candidatus Pacearchaeota archaeon]